MNRSVKHTWLLSALLILPLIYPKIIFAESKDEVSIWRFSHFLPARHSMAKAMAEWATALEQATGNQLKIDVYPAGQLGSADDHYDVIRTRIAHLGWIVPGYEQGRFPIFSVLETPFLVSDSAAGASAFHTWYTQYAALEMANVVPCLMTASPPGRLSFKQEMVTKPEQMRGKRIRVSNATVGRYVRNLGGVTINIPVSEVRHALEKGMIDAMPFDLYSIKALSLEHLVDHHLDMPFASAPALVGINKQALEALPQELQATVKSFCSAEWSSKVVSAWQQLEVESLEIFRNDSERTLYRLSAAETAAWLDETQPLYDEWQKLALRKGLSQPQAALDNLFKLLEQNAAGFTAAD